METRSIKRLLVANRGEIAVRIMRTARAMGVECVAVYSDADAGAPHVQVADIAVRIGPAPVSQSYLRVEAILEAARAHDVDAIHPGYGLLSENAEFAAACEAAGIAFVGPAPEQIRSFGLKHKARALAEESGVPLVPGTGLIESAAEAAEEAQRIGFPVMIKSTAGGGGIGMSVCRDARALAEAFARVERLAASNFGTAGIFIEKFIERARHLEVQIFGDGKGRAVSLGVRDCSAQRRNQKVIEETPPAGVPSSTLEALEACAVRLAESVSYRSAGTVEFIYDVDSGEFYFLEVNTRLQVEHGVTEMVTGVDLVERMIRLADGEHSLDWHTASRPGGHSIQVRIYAEDPAREFQPSSGLLTRVAFPESIRCDTWVETGTEVSGFYDPLLAKLIVHASDRPSALSRLESALADTELHGIETNLGYLAALIGEGLMNAGRMTTSTLASFTHRPRTFEVLRPGTQTTVQDFPGRIGYWEVGVPPSGPMDSLSFRLLNRLVGNESGAAGLEITAQGPRLRFNTQCTVAVGGADVPVALDGQPVGCWAPLDIAPGQVLDIGAPADAGVRSYLVIRGGIDVPDYLGSKSTFTLGKFGGHGGRALRAGDVLRLVTPQPDDLTPRALPEMVRPSIGNDWEIGVLPGPHGAPDFFTAEDIEEFFSAEWKVHYNSARTGVRLIGPKPRWAREDGGEAGLHPSNIHDNAYAIGTIDFTGDMPVILGPDGPSLGGFVCPATLVASELWKMGQLRPGDTVRFVCLDAVEAASRLEEQERQIHDPWESAHRTEMPQVRRIPEAEENILARHGEGEHAWVIRRAGSENVLVECGPQRLDLRLRLRVHLLYERLNSDRLRGVLDLTPGIRSLQVHFDARIVSVATVMEWIEEALEDLDAVQSPEIPSRIIHLPLSWDDPATREAIRKYMQSVRADAPWCPDNIEFIRRINGLQSIEDVRRVVFDASYVVLGLGDVYLGAPVATPLDPRHRLVTTKYNPARTWTPENAVGIGGAYMCIYGMEGPGGYQFVGRTIQMWNRYRSTDSFAPGKPWLLRFFDQVRFYPVSADELIQLREDFPLGRFSPTIEESSFSLAAYEDFLASNEASITAFKSRQQASFEEERGRWKQGETTMVVDSPALDAGDETLPEGSEPVPSVVSGSLWKLLVGEGDKVEAGQTLAIVESMKMEIPIESPRSGRVACVRAREGGPVAPGDTIVALACE